MVRRLYRNDVIRIMLFSLFAGIMFWVMDAVIDTIIFYREETLWGQLFFNLKFFNIYNRVVVIVLFILFGAFFSRMFIAQKRAEQALRESEEKFKKISSSAQDAIIMIDFEGKISFWNEAAENIFGVSQDDVLGREFATFIANSNSRESFQINMLKFKETGEADFIGKIIEIVSLRNDGSEFPAEVSFASVQLGGFWNGIGILRDVTKRKQMEQNFIFSLTSIRLLARLSASSLLLLKTWSATRVADFSPIPGNRVNCSISFSRDGG